jgi:hypothetical protein
MSERTNALVMLWMIFAFGHSLLPAQPKSIFVSPSGSDSNDGLSLARPIKSINFGLNLASAGDTVYLLPGTYREIAKIVQRKGIAERPLCLYSYYSLPESRAVIDGGAVTPSNTNLTNIWMDIENSDWIEIGGIEFRNGWTNPVQVINSSYLTFNNCYFSGGKRVIVASGASSHHLLVQNCYWDQGGNYLWKLVADPAGADAWTSMHEGALQYFNGSLIDFSGTGGSVVVRNNTIVNAFNGIRWSAQKNCDANVEIYDNVVSNIRDNDFEPENFTFNLHIYHNYSHNIHKTMSVDHVQGGYIYYYGNRVTSDIDSWSNSICSSFWKVYGEGALNLTYPMYAFNNSFCGVGKVFAMDAGTLAAQVNHFNNAYYITGSRTWMVDAVDSTDHFDFDISNKTWALNLSNRNQEKNGLVDDIQFANVKTFDLHLKPTSVGIDRGTQMSFQEFGWTQSFQGTAPDVGAYEGADIQEGPPFRFRIPPGVLSTYTEKPRIVRSRVAGNTLALFFSAPIDPSTVSASAALVTLSGAPLRVVSLSLSDDNYTMNIGIEPGRTLNEQSLAVGFNPLPKGANGETATLWGAALAAYRKPILTAVAEPKPSQPAQAKLSADIYPNPISRQSRVSVRVPSLPGAVSGRMRIFDVLGRILEERSLTQLKDTFDFDVPLERYSAGTYFLVVQIGDQQISKKFVVLK